MVDTSGTVGTVDAACESCFFYGVHVFLNLP